LVDICGYELPINLKNFTQQDLTEVKIVKKVFRGSYFFETPFTHVRKLELCSYRIMRNVDV